MLTMRPSCVTAKFPHGQRVCWTQAALALVPLVHEVVLIVFLSHMLQNCNAKEPGHQHCNCCQCAYSQVLVTCRWCAS